MPIERFVKLSAVGLIAMVFACNVYRASVLSITADEAISYRWFLDGPVSLMFNLYNAAHHVLHTYLEKISISLLGVSEFTMRVPSLLGGLLFLVSAFRLCGLCFGWGGLGLLAFATLILNPFQIDYLSVARGYGLASGFACWGLYHLVVFTSDRGKESGGTGKGHLIKAGIGFGMAVAANLTMACAAAAMAVTLAALLSAEALANRDPHHFMRQVWFVARYFLAPAIAVAAPLLILPLRTMQPGTFYAGVPSLQDTLSGLVSATFFYVPERYPALGRYYDLLQAVMRRAVPAVIACAALAMGWVFRRRLRSGGAERGRSVEHCLFLCGGSLVIILAGLAALHVATGLLYPYLRTALFMVPLFCLTLFSVPGILVAAKNRGARAGAIVLSVCLAVVPVYFVLEFDLSRYWEWGYDAGTKRIIAQLQARESRSAPESVRIGCAWVSETSLNFYRKLYGLKWMKPPDRSGPDADYDYYVLLPPDYGLLRSRGLRVLYRDRVSAAVLAIRERGGAASHSNLSCDSASNLR